MCLAICPGQMNWCPTVYAAKQAFRFSPDLPVHDQVVYYGQATRFLNQPRKVTMCPTWLQSVLSRKLSISSMFPLQQISEFWWSHLFLPWRVPLLAWGVILSCSCYLRLQDVSASSSFYWTWAVARLWALSPMQSLCTSTAWKSHISSSFLRQF